MTNIDASLRRPILPQNNGDTVPDSKPLLADTPQLIMEPGVSRPSYRFDDGDGLTDAFGNVYVGYGNGGSSTTFSNSPPETVTDEIDVAADLDILQFNATRQLYEPKSIPDAGLAKVSTSDPPNDGDLLQYSSGNLEYQPVTIEEAGMARVGGGTPNDGDVLTYNTTFGDYRPEAPSGGGGTPSPFDITDFIAGIIEVPQNRSYLLVQSMPYDITIINTSHTTSTGSVSVSFPSGTISAGNPLSITVSGAGGAGVDEFTTFEIEFTRTLTP